MRVVLVDPSHQVPGYARSLAAGLAALGDDVTLATAPLLYYAPGPTPPGVRVTHPFGRLLGRSPAGPPDTDWRVRRPLARRLLRGLGYPWELAAFVLGLGAARPDVVHLQWSLVPDLDAAALAVLRRAGIRGVVTAHNVLPHEPRPWHARGFRRLYRAADRVVVHSRATAERLRRLAGPGVRVDVVPMAADAPGAAPDRAAARGRLALPADAPVALFFGHIRPYKGLSDLVAAWPRVRARAPGARLVVAGPLGGARSALAGGAAGDPRALAAGGIETHLGFVPADDVAAYIAAADVVVLPYRDTDDSAVLAIAHGHGRAAVATAVGGLPEALAGGGGRLVPPGDPAALAAAIGDVLLDLSLRERLETEARAAARRWTWADAAAATRAVYARARTAARGYGTGPTR